MAASAPALSIPVQTIDQVIQALDQIIDWSWTTRNRIGYFAGLYRRVTSSVKEGIDQGKFQNGPLMEQLDVTFANRYLQAYEQHRSGQSPTRSWQLAFQVSAKWYPLVVQQLLIGINAHINLDLGIAAAAIAPGNQLPGLKTDFDQINAVLASLVGTVEKEIAQVSPLIGLLETFGLKTETAIINFSIDVARDAAWSHATKLAVTPPDQLPAAINQIDVETQEFGRDVVMSPFLRLSLIRIFETNNIRRVIDVLAAKPVAKAATA
jgi:Family of unknown function (DUF5995)